MVLRISSRRYDGKRGESPARTAHTYIRVYTYTHVRAYGTASCPAGLAFDGQNNQFSFTGPPRRPHLHRPRDGRVASRTMTIAAAADAFRSNNNNTRKRRRLFYYRYFFFLCRRKTIVG